MRMNALLPFGKFSFFFRVTRGCMWFALIWAGLSFGNACAADESAERSHEELLTQAEQILLSGGERQEAKRYLEEARKLASQSPGLRFPSKKYVDYYYAWILCREPDSKQKEEGRLIFNKLSHNDWFPPDKMTIVERELERCGTDLQGAAVKVVTKEVWALSSSQKGGKWSQPIRLDNASLPLLSWTHKNEAIDVIKRRVAPLTVVESKPFIIVGKRTGSYMQELANKVLKPYYTYLAKQLDVSEDDAIIYVFVTSDHKDFAEKTRALYRVSPQDRQAVELAIAYTEVSSNTMMAICGRHPGNCTSFAHELFHLMNSKSFEDAPWWIYEGMAELYESGDIIGSDFSARVGWRKWHLQLESLDERSLREMLTLSKNDPKLYEPPGPRIAMARSRFFCQYLHERGMLWKLYYELRKRDSIEAGVDPAGIKTIEKVLDRPIDKVAVDFKGWIKTNVDPIENVPKMP